LWRRSFVGRLGGGELSLRRPRIIEEASRFHVLVVTLSQERYISPDDLRQWFDSLTPLMQQKNYPADLIFNMDETFLHVDSGRAELVLASRAERPVITHIRHSGKHITLAVVRP